MLTDDPEFQDTVGELDGLLGHRCHELGPRLRIGIVAPHAAQIREPVRIDDPLTGGHVVSAIERVRRLVQQAIDVSLQLCGSIEVGRITRRELTAHVANTIGEVV